MSDTQVNDPLMQPLTKQAQLQNIEHIRDLFARAHDYIAQASHPGHMGAKVAEVLDFLAFHYGDFKTRCEGMAKQIEAEAKSELSKVNMEDAKAATDAVLSSPDAITGPK